MAGLGRRIVRELAEKGWAGAGIVYELVGRPPAFYEEAACTASRMLEACVRGRARIAYRGEPGRLAAVLGVEYRRVRGLQAAGLRGAGRVEGVEHPGRGVLAGPLPRVARAATGLLLAGYRVEWLEAEGEAACSPDTLRAAEALYSAAASAYQGTPSRRLMRCLLLAGLLLDAHHSITEGRRIEGYESMTEFPPVKKLWYEWLRARLTEGQQHREERLKAASSSRPTF